jgi:hypothetical protein
MAKRLRPLTDTKPKCLLEVGSRTLLQRTVDAMLLTGISELVVVTGYRGSMIRDFLTAHYPQLNIHFLHNADYEHNNNIFSLWMTRPYTDGRDFLLMDSDILCDPKAVAEVARQQLRRDSPRTHGGRGHYWSGWRVDSKQLDSYGVNGTRAVVYNYNKPTLTHLLERGHDIVRGGRGRRGVVVGHAEGIPHIGRAREAALRHLTQRGW